MSTARPTKADVARLAEVSTATISYVLNNVEGHRISEQTQAAVDLTADCSGAGPFVTASATQIAG